MHVMPSELDEKGMRALVLETSRPATVVEFDAVATAAYAIGFSYA